MENSPCLDAALAYAERGWYVHPLYWVIYDENAEEFVPTRCSCRDGERCGGKDDIEENKHKWGKHPIWTDWENRATNDPDEIRAIWGEGGSHPDANIGGAAGKSGRWVLDMDGAEGEDTLWAWGQRGWHVPDTLTHETGSGGMHFIHPMPNIELRNTVRSLGAGLDSRGIGGYIVLPPSMSGVGAYSVLRDFPEAPLPEWLLDLLTRERSEAPVALVESAERLDQFDPDRLARYVVAAIDREIHAVANAERGDWNNRLFRAALKLGQLGALGLITEEEGQQWLLDASSDRGHRGREAYGTFRSGWHRGMQDPRRLPDSLLRRGGQAFDPEGATPAEGEDDDDRAARDVIVDMIRASYELRKTTGGQYVAVPTGEGEPRLAISLDGEIKREINRRWFEMGNKMVAQSAVEEAVKMLVALADADPEPVTLHLRAARTPAEELIIDLGDRTGQVIVVTDQGWDVVTPASGAPLFRRGNTASRLPMPTRGGRIERLAELLGMAPNSDQWQLLLGWLVAAPFADVARPIMWVTGVQGSAKSTRGRIIASIWDPRIELGAAPGKDSDGDRALAMSRFIPGFDNLSKINQETSDWLCRLITGASDSKRALYTDNDLIEYNYRRTAVVTSRYLPTGLEADAQERTIQLAFQRLAGYRPEDTVQGEFVQAHEEILGALLDLISGLLGHLETVRREERRSLPRMAHFALILAALDASAGTRTFDAYCEHMHNAMANRAADDPFVGAVISLLDAKEGPWSGTAGELMKALDGAMTLDQRLERITWMPKTPRGLVPMLTRASEPLRAVGIVWEQSDRRLHGSRPISIWRQGDVEGLAGDVEEVLQPTSPQ